MLVFSMMVFGRYWDYALVLGAYMPDAVIYLDLDVFAGMSRTFDAAGDKFEKFPPEFFARCRDGYAFLAQHERFRDRWRTIDARGSREEVFSRILATGIVDIAAKE